MANRTLKIQITTAGSTIGPFSIYHTSISAPNLLATGVTRQQLIDGYYIDVDTLYNVLFIKSTGQCSTEDSFTYSIVPTPAPTAAPTATPTAAPVTPAPITPAPVTPEPIAPPSTSPTPAPVTPAPVTPSPVTPAPITPAPVTPSPVTPAPVTPAPTTPAPVTPEPTAPAPTAANCSLYQLNGGSSGGQIQYTECDGQVENIFLYSYQSHTVCAVVGSVSTVGAGTAYIVFYGISCTT